MSPSESDRDKNVVASDSSKRPRPTGTGASTSDEHEILPGSDIEEIGTSRTGERSDPQSDAAPDGWHPMESSQHIAKRVRLEGPELDTIEDLTRQGASSSDIDQDYVQSQTSDQQQRPPLEDTPQRRSPHETPQQSPSQQSPLDPNQQQSSHGQTVKLAAPLLHSDSLPDLSLSLTSRESANEWIMDVLASSSTNQQFWWKILEQFWKTCSKDVAAEGAARQLIEYLQETAVKKVNSGELVPAPIVSTLFCAPSSTSRGKQVLLALDRGFERWTRKPSCLDWDTFATRRAPIDPAQNAFQAIRVFFQDSEHTDPVLQQTNEQLFAKLFAASATPYRGESLSAFATRLASCQSDVVSAMADASVRPYGQIVPLVQSTGTGKSRLLQELAACSVEVDGSPRRIVTLTMRLGDERSFPPPDTYLRDIFVAKDGLATSDIVSIFLHAVSDALTDLSMTERDNWLRNFALPTSENRYQLWESVMAYVITGSTASGQLCQAIQQLVEMLQPSFFVLAIDEAQCLTEVQLADLRRNWAPSPQDPSKREMCRESFLCLAGTSNQLDGLAPIPAQSGSGRLSSGMLYLPSPFTALHTGCLEPKQWSEERLFSNWHCIGRPLWDVLPRSSCWERIQHLIPSVMTSTKITEDDLLTLLTQRVSLDILSPGKIAGTFELYGRVRSLTTRQVNNRLWWLSQATCRGLDVKVCHLSEPLPAFYCGYALTRRRDGWEQVLQALARLMRSFEVATYNAGELGELLAQILCCASMDLVRFSTLPALSLEDAQAAAAVNLIDVLAKLVGDDLHRELREKLDSGGRLSFTRFKIVTQTVRSISQAQLAQLWYSGEAIQACPGQAGWDLLVPIKYQEGFSVWLIQAKNQPHGPRWAQAYATPAVFPDLPDAGHLQAVLSYCEVSGVRSTQREVASELRVLRETTLTRSGSSDAGSKLCIGTWGPVSVSQSTLEKAYPVTREACFSRAFKELVSASWVEGAVSEEERNLLARAAPGPL